MYNFFTQFPTFLKQFNWKNNKINKNEENEEYLFQLYTSKWERKGKIEINIRKEKKTRKKSFLYNFNNLQLHFIPGNLANQNNNINFL